MDVIVIGGGLAGLAAAERLAGAGATVTLLEARERLGGRVRCERGAEGRQAVDLGAEWVGDEGEVHDLLIGAGARLVASEGRQLRRVDGGWQDVSKLHPKATRLVRRAVGLGGRDRSLAEALGECCPDASPEREHLIRYVEGFHAADPEELSVRWLSEVEASQPADASENRSTVGVGLLVDTLRERLAGRCDLRLRTVAKEVRWRPGAVEVATADGASLQAAAVVITLPLPLLLAGAREPAGLQFHPPLEAKLAGARGLRMGSVVKVVLEFRDSFWRDIAELDEALFIHAYEQPVPTWWLPVEPTAPILTGWAGGPFASRVAGMAGAAVAELAVGSVADALGMTRGAVGERVTAWHFHDWASDPFTRGGYTYVGVGGVDAHRALAEPVAGTLYFAGEATCGGGYNATMEGAFRSGRRAADELLGG